MVAVIMVATATGQVFAYTPWYAKWFQAYAFWLVLVIIAVVILRKLTRAYYDD